MALTTIPIPVIDGYALSGATLTSLTRLDTDASVTLPDSVAFALNDDETAWEVQADLPAGVDVAWEADVTYAGGGTSGADGVVTAGAATQAGTYWTWEGIKNLLGTDNAAVVSNLDNDTTDADLSRVAADGAIADDYVNWWAAETGHVTPVADTSRDFGRVKLAANYKTSGLLYGHREWWEIPNEQLDQYVNVMEAKADAILAELFGPKPSGTDAEKLPDGDPTPPAGTFQFVPINRGTRRCGDEYSSGCC